MTVKKGFIAAVGVNRNEGYASSFIRTYTQIAKRIKTTNKGQVPDETEINLTSDIIAQHILSRIIKNQGLIPTFNQLQEIDFKYASRELKLQPLQGQELHLVCFQAVKDLFHTIIRLDISCKSLRICDLFIHLRRHCNLQTIFYKEIGR